MQFGIRELEELCLVFSRKAHDDNLHKNNLAYSLLGVNELPQGQLARFSFSADAFPVYVMQKHKPSLQFNKVRFEGDGDEGDVLIPTREMNVYYPKIDAKLFDANHMLEMEKLVKNYYDMRNQNLNAIVKKSLFIGFNFGKQFGYFSSLQRIERFLAELRDKRTTHQILASTPLWFWLCMTFKAQMTDDHNAVIGKYGLSLKWTEDNRISPNLAFFFPPEFHSGVVPVRQGVTLIPAHSPKNQKKYGFVFYEELGLAVGNVNDRHMLVVPDDLLNKKVLVDNI